MVSVLADNYRRYSSPVSLAEKQEKHEATKPAAAPSNERWSNWSNNHAYSPSKTLRPDSLQQVQELVREHHAKGENLRCVGSGLSPNGLGFGPDGSVALSLEKMNRTIYVDKERRIAKFEAGTTVGQVVEELAAEGLMLENLASINLQQLGGFYQVSAHGTGGGIPPVDEQILELTIVTPGMGTLVLSKEKDPDLFNMCKVGLGCLGVVTDFTVRCVPLHRLREETRVISRADLAKQHREIVSENKHAKYMWVPYEDKVVVVTANETSDEISLIEDAHDRLNALSDMHELFQKLIPHQEVPVKLNFADLRTVLLAPANLDADHVKHVNKAEAKYHTKVSGSVVKRADQTMAFDCGGQQLVLEVAMKSGADKHSADGKDVAFVQRLLERIEKERIPAPVPIEHRFTSGTSSTMSPVHGDGLYGWVGVVLYMPSPVQEDRAKVIAEFERYSKVTMAVAKEMGVDARIHWAKLEIPHEETDLKELRAMLAKQYPLDTFREVRRRLDPKGILLSPWAATILESKTPTN